VIEEQQLQLRRLYNFKEPFYLLIQETAIFIVEGPDASGRVPPEAVLTLFMSPQDAAMFRDVRGLSPSLEVRKITLVGLWNLLDRIDELSQKMYNAPIRIEVAAFDGRRFFTVDTLHSIYELAS
jgi:hypothetical protein